MARQEEGSQPELVGNRYSDALNHINMVIHSGLDFDSIMAKVVVEIARTIGAESAVIFMPDDDGWTARYTYGMPEEMLNQHFATEELSYSAQAARQKAAVVINDPSQDNLVKSDIIDRYGIKAILDVALTIREKMVGNFSIHYHTTDKKFTDLEVDFVNKAASTITLALKNAMLLQERKEAEEAIRDNERKVLQTLDRLMILVGVSSRVLGETTIGGTLNQAVAGAIAITDALIAASGHGYSEGDFTLSAIATDAPFPPCPADTPFTVKQGGVHLDLLHKVSTIRFTQEELVNHPLWWGLPEGHAPLNGLLGARLEGAEGKTNGMILVSHKRHGQFTEEDEVLLTQLCQLTSLAIRHIEARHAVEEHAAQLETVGRQLKESEERFREFFTNAPIGMVIMDLEGRFEAVNTSYCEIFGYEPEEILKSDFTFVNITHPDDVARNLAEMNQVISGEKKSFFIEKRNVRKDGRYIWVRVSATICFGESGRPVRTIAIVEDIQDRKEAEEALKISETNYRTIFDSANDSFFIQNADSGAIVDVNQKVLEMYHYSYDEIIRLDVGALSVDSAGYTQERAMNVCRRAAMGEPQLVEWLAQDKHGRTFWVEVSLKKVILNGKDRLLAIVRDIGQRKKAEEDLKQAMEELSRSNRELEQFAYIASHDLQEPLRMVSSYVKLLERKYRGRLDANADTYINFAVDGASRMQKLIEGLLAYSRISRGSRLQPVDTASPLRAALANLEPAIGESGAEITSPVTLPTVLGDEMQLMQLFQNLIGNALKYRRKDIPPRVVVSASREADEWVFCVQDNGIGIDAQYFDRIFQIFQRLHGQAEFEGTGIGLASCKKIVERHGGRIWVESRPGEGSAFFFTLSPSRGAGEGTSAS